jgi:hypothetical protein
MDEMENIDMILLLGRALAIRAISQNACGAAQLSRYPALRNNSPKK